MPYAHTVRDIRMQDRRSLTRQLILSVRIESCFHPPGRVYVTITRTVEDFRRPMTGFRPEMTCDRKQTCDSNTRPPLTRWRASTVYISPNHLLLNTTKIVWCVSVTPKGHSAACLDKKTWAVETSSLFKYIPSHRKGEAVAGGQ